MLKEVPGAMSRKGTPFKTQKAASALCAGGSSFIV